MILLEAMAAEIPIVASDLPGYRKVIGEGEPAALLVPPGDPTALGVALRRVLDDAGLAASLAAAGEARAATFSMDRLAARYVELYRSAIAGTSPV